MASVRPRTRSLAVVAAVVFAAIGLFATWVGLLDFLSAANLQYKLLGFAFAIAGLTMLGGSVVLAREPWRCTHGRLAAVAAGAAGVFVRGYSRRAVAMAIRSFSARAYARRTIQGISSPDRGDAHDVPESFTDLEGCFAHHQHIGLTPVETDEGRREAQAGLVVLDRNVPRKLIQPPI
jgi:hypothetical protein